MGYLRWIVILFCFLGMVACHQDVPHFRIGVAQCSDDSWRHKMNDEILREAMFYDGVAVEIRSAGDDNRKQAEDVRYFMDKGVDLLIISANEAAPMTPVVEEAYQKGIPVILIDRKILSDKYTAYIGADNYEIGRAVGNYIASSLQGKGNVVELTGLGGATPAMERHQGFMAAISNFPDIKLIDKADAAWESGPAEVEMDSMLCRHPKIDAVYAHNDRIAPGAYRAAKKVGREKEMLFVGIDALPGKGNGLELVLDSVLNATFIYPTNGDKVMQLAMNILEKKPYPRETVMNTAVVDHTNAHVMKLQTTHISELDQKIETLNGRIGGYLSRVATQQVVMYGGLVILLLVAGLLLVVYKSLRSKNRLNRELSEQKKQLEEQRDKLEGQRDKLEEQRDQLIQLSHQLEEATHAKLVFFTNISHDFRTPLTLVADPVEHLLADKTLNGDQHRMLMLIQRNVNILLRLVNQILDFRKYENGMMEYTPVPVDILSSFEGWNESFLAAARKKHIHFSFDKMADTDYHTLADVEKLERIYFNLLSNAFKFTPENGKVTVRLSPLTKEDGRWIRFTVANTGSMISVEHIRNIFDRFYRIDMHHAGSGIGLALVKAFVELHKGTISVESDEKQGTIFTVDLPMQTCEVTVSVDSPLSSSIGASVSSALNNAQVAEEEEPEKDYDSSKPSVLVIDDNADIRSYVYSLLHTDYTVIEAVDGSDGIRKAMKYVPDLIISDVMMPGIDGIECCRRLKSELQTCHIPVILLTACSLDEQRIQGYDGGADSYISKPFSSQLLLARVRNLIDSHRRLKQFFGDRHTLAKEDVCDMDKNFVEKFKSLLDAKLGDSNLNVEDLGKDMGLSRVQLYRKIKSLTNYSPNELLRIARLKKAASLLASSDMTVAEIGYEVGFSSPSYFTKCYKEQFGESPTDFLKRRG
ncbi:substrate-binding domain-containing protein [Bacteroides finegoldii]|jgi:signal transduction histidine kinase/DNA-binding response OmpR family regulator/ABC-type xylose transport system substrate-binding protein|uniref:histidine kinase n=3 Tax=Bacteroides finegoldii TaxID=338188 RepID=A0A7J4YMK7_9BACE|nr:substrate-binding domain-containing protein [Bacteroides finegoldii]EEX43268.1 ATPase/histidine kinase/DNA gyrase B/HSP90 domain protein [Bacteroides finegoldii DSM 17565]KAA5215383.1 substrate-binding domain-containing protein [Bacteroides finegoldii]KAA5218890.1 substrate-binding domain-containing protein [Bacteroides finegoldii]KAA5225000.1 substrate-binding domain-containing protein [Bacteroides finegoldii]KAA5229614.1 substrate-binding domain-containing protein [Bacteroides finegoldii]